MDIYERMANGYLYDPADGDQPYDELMPELKESLHEYYKSANTATLNRRFTPISAANSCTSATGCMQTST